MLTEKTFVATPKYPFKYSHQFEAAHEGLFLKFPIHVHFLDLKFND